MPMKYAPVTRVPRLLHGGDYNPDQWLDQPEILKEDLRLMKLAKVNVVSLGIFAWVALEPEEGVFRFDWLDRVLDDLAENGISAFLSTPTGARPAWMSVKYPEVLRVNADRRRNLHGGRHNHCYTSPVYRAKTRIINTKLAERYHDHPALILWHISNEYGGECHCDLCQQAFRAWLKERYHNDLDVLNKAWWTSFWSHTYTAWSQIESPSPIGEGSVHGLTLDWKRFVTYQTVDFMQHEIAPLKQITPEIPVTTNFMELYNGLDYWKFQDVLDVVCWDSYPWWHAIGSRSYHGRIWDEAGRDWKMAVKTAFMHNIMRCIKGGQPFLLMESTPSMTNWQAVGKLKRPGMHLLSSLQAVAHGSDSVQYFQWRKSRGSAEKFHGAVVDHVGHEHTRVFQEVVEVGNALEHLTDVVGSEAPAPVAIIFDWENRWALEDAAGPRNDGLKAYAETCINHYEAFWKQGVTVDVIDSTCDFSSYQVVVAPMLYMLKPGVAERLRAFVANGGVLVATYWSGIVDEHDLCFLGGAPGELQEMFGVWAEEIDALYPDERNALVMRAGAFPKGQAEYAVFHLCDLIHLRGARALADYKSDFYAGRPAFTVNQYGEGQAYYVAARTEQQFLDDFYAMLIAAQPLPKALNMPIPEGISVQARRKGDTEFIFMLNFLPETHTLTLPAGITSFDLLSQQSIADRITLKPYGVAVLRRQ